MPHAIDRLGGPAAARGLAGAALMLLFGFAGTAAAADISTEFRLAQAQQKPAARQAQPPADPTESQLGDLKKRLAITPAQQPQFDAFAQVVKQNAQEMNTLMQQEQAKAGTAVDNLRSSAQIAQAEADGLKKMVPPLEALYTSLSDQQKKTADQVLSNAGGNQGPPPPQSKKKG